MFILSAREIDKLNCKEGNNSNSNSSNDELQQQKITIKQLQNETKK